ncbi:nucleotide-diphospho-sugar transferase [Aspergillus alliaceus]|uniref:nucleotide-diphospho-sugar transferase n=1 Tax=Petromyces alliaceus TaxID=209559 RepID=UPI0012A3BD86|nr:nucleotide-diphospho-sugar transferase [Aspergillus alliaceus]KAB8234049.1 nucleotide-diphospho-sugar transferase [Aspergillus alliaceus]
MLAPRRTILASVVAFFLLYTLPDRQSQLWRRLHSLLEQHAPDCPPPILQGGAGVPRFDAISETPRKNYISNVDEIRLPMQAAHDSFVHAIRNLKDARVYTPGTMGIVSSAGGTYLPTFVVSLLLLRRTGSTLPVELFMKDWTEYEPYICETILPPLGVKCLVLSEILSGQDDIKSTHSIEGFQIKSFAMLFSSFEKFLWLDADCVPLHNPITILNSEPFTSTGLVTWPDFWANTAAPVYFNISRQPEPLSTTRQATEAGQLLVSKESHFLTLILAAYYNYYGPDYYYPILDQGAPGAGDKDTFLHAATALNQRFYSVSETVVDLGNITPWDSRIAINAGYIQADPIQDFNLTSQGKWRVQDPSISKPPRAFFIHAGDPEFNPGEELLGKKLLGFDGNPTRLWTYPPEAIKRLGYDAEKMFWEETMSVACTMQSAFKTWKSKTSLCEDVRAHWRAVFQNPDIKVPEFIDG